MTTVTEGRPRLCSDPAHDDRWCATCEAMWDGVELAMTYFLNQAYLWDGFKAWLADGRRPGFRPAGTQSRDGEIA